MKHKKILKCSAAIVVLAAFVAFCLLMSRCTAGSGEEKPVIYLYPDKQTQVTVTLDYDGALTTTYPKALIEKNGSDHTATWRVLASPDGTLTDLTDSAPASKNEYSYLFWEGNSDSDYDLSTGYCVAGEDTAAFLQDVLAQMGLTAREYNEFIVYWLPQMEQNPYNLITFQQEAYTEMAKLQIDPTPDSLLRVFMAWKPLSHQIAIDSPQITPFVRKGFTVVEWGGCRLAPALSTYFHSFSGYSPLSFMD